MSPSPPASFSSTSSNLSSPRNSGSNFSYNHFSTSPQYPQNFQHTTSHPSQPPPTQHQLFNATSTTQSLPSPTISQTTNRTRALLPSPAPSYRTQASHTPYSMSRGSSYSIELDSERSGPFQFSGSSNEGSTASPNLALEQAQTRAEYFRAVQDEAPRDRKDDCVELMSNNVYVNGLEINATDDDLLEIGSRFGEVLSHKAIICEHTGECKGFGFILYADRLGASTAINGFQAAGFFASAAKESYRAKFRRLSDRSCANVYVSNLPVRFNVQNLEAMCLPYTSISSRIITDKSGISKGVGFMRFDSRETAQRVISLLHLKTLHGSSNPLQARFADSEAQKRLRGSSRSSTSSAAGDEMEHEINVEDPRSRRFSHPPARQLGGKNSGFGRIDFFGNFDYKGEGNLNKEAYPRSARSSSSPSVCPALRSNLSIQPRFSPSQLLDRISYFASPNSSSSPSLEASSYSDYSSQSYSPSTSSGTSVHSPDSRRRAVGSGRLGLKALPESIHEGTSTQFRWDSINPNDRTHQPGPVWPCSVLGSSNSLQQSTQNSGLGLVLNAENEEFERDSFGRLSGTNGSKTLGSVSIENQERIERNGSHPLNRTTSIPVRDLEVINSLASLDIGFNPSDSDLEKSSTLRSRTSLASLRRKSNSNAPSSIFDPFTKISSASTPQQESSSDFQEKNQESNPSSDFTSRQAARSRNTEKFGLDHGISFSSPVLGATPSETPWNEIGSRFNPFDFDPDEDVQMLLGRK